MTRYLSLLGALLCLALPSSVAAQSQIYLETFETDGNPARYETSVPEAITDDDPNNSTARRNYFTRTDGSTISTQVSFSGADGFYFAAQDVDDATGGTNPVTLTIPDIDISSVTSGLEFRARFAEDDATASGQPSNDWDSSDEVNVYATVSGGTRTLILSIQASGDQANTAPSIDTDFDGVGDGTEITDTFQELAAAIAGTGSTLTIEVEFNLNGNNEDIAIDDIQIFGTVATPPPPPPVGSQIYQETFETDGNPARYTTTPSEYVSTDNNRDYFLRTDGTEISGGVEVTGPEGSFWLAAQDVDGEGEFADRVSITIPNIDISNVTGDLEVRALYAEDDATDGSEDWDTSDEVELYASIDGGPDVLVFSIQSGSSSNTFPRVDSDLDGTGADTDAEITSTFTEYAAAIMGTGLTLTLRYEIQLNGGDEDINIDDIRVFGTVRVDPPPPPPNTQFYRETFETDGNPDRYTTSDPEAVSPNSDRDYFLRTDGSGITDRTTLSGTQGSFFFGAQDIDFDGRPRRQTITISDIDISDATSSLEVRALYATAYEDGNSTTWDGSDEVLLFASIDGGDEQRILSIQSTESSNGTTRVTAPAASTAEDTDPELTPTFTEYIATISGTGSLLTLRYEIELNGGDEDIAIDDIRVLGNAPQKATVAFSSASGGSLEEMGGETMVDVVVTTSDGEPLEAPVSGAITVTMGDNDDDFALTGDEFSFTAGTTTGATSTVTVTAQDDNEIEDTETFELSLSDVTGAVEGEPDTFTFSIIDDESEGSVAFSSVQRAVSEGDGSITLTIKLSGDPSEDVTVIVELASGDPTDLGGFESASLLVGSEGDTYTVEVPITDDGAREPTETFIFALRIEDESGDAAGVLSVGSPSQTAILIVDNDQDAVSVKVPPRDADGDGVEDGGPRLLSLPLGGLTAGELAEAAGVDEVFGFRDGTMPVLLDLGTLLMAGELVLLDVAPGADLTITGRPSTDDSVVSTGLEAGPGRMLVPVGNPTDGPIALSEIALEGGTLADVALVFDADAGSFRPVSLSTLADDLVLEAFSGVVLQVIPDDGATSVTAAIALDGSAAGTGSSIREAVFAPLEDETAIVVTLAARSTSGATAAPSAIASAPGDQFVLRLLEDADAGLDLFDGVDLVSPIGATLAAGAPRGDGPPPAPLAALALDPLTPGTPLSVPLVVVVPEAGTYELSFETLSAAASTVYAVQVLDRGAPTTVLEGGTFSFIATEAEAADPAGLAGRLVLRVTTRSTVATEDVLEGLAIEVYPNPSAGRATVVLEGAPLGDVRVSVYDALGREVAVLHDGASPAGGFEVSVPSLAPGTYLVRIDGEGAVVTRTLTVAR